MKNIVQQIKSLLDELERLPMKERIETLNQIKQELHKRSPFRSEPVDCVIWVPAHQVQANDYNPNTVAPPEMKLLELSIVLDGYTQPIVAFPDKREDREYTVIDGFHRSRVGKESRKVQERVNGYLPISVIGEDRISLRDRMASTIRHNRARGVHGVIPMMDVVRTLIQEGWRDSQIAEQLGMDMDEILRYKQSVGLPELFKDREYSKSWM